MCETALDLLGQTSGGVSGGGGPSIRLIKPLGVLLMYGEAEDEEGEGWKEMGGGHGTR